MTAFSKKLIVFVFLTVFAAFLDAPAQSGSTETARRVNFGYSQNPKTKNKAQNSDARAVAQTVQTAAAIVVPIENNLPTLTGDIAPPDEFESRSVAVKTLEVANRANAARAVSPTEIYKVGVGDVLFISLRDAPAKASTYFTVLNDGTIDYPLANEMISVAGLTSDEIENLLREKVKLYENPQISVKVRENTSHSITVLGLIEKAGEKFLQREAVPLYVIKAEAVVLSRANQVFIKRANSQNEIVDLKDAKSEDVLIFPGDIVEFKFAGSVNGDASTAPQYYYIGGEIKSAGQKDFHPGLTLTQAILASGGLRKSTVNKAVVRRKNEQGLLSPIEFDLSAVKSGKQPDPMLQPGDTIEVVKY